jgi:hypothetical protein
VGRERKYSLEFPSPAQRLNNVRYFQLPIRVTAQSLLGHSDLGTTLNTYAHVIPGSQRRAVERVAGVLFSDVLRLEDGAKDGRVNWLCS